MTLRGRSFAVLAAAVGRRIRSGWTSPTTRVPLIGLPILVVLWVAATLDVGRLGGWNGPLDHAQWLLATAVAAATGLAGWHEATGADRRVRGLAALSMIFLFASAIAEQDPIASAPGLDGLAPALSMLGIVPGVAAFLAYVRIRLGPVAMLIGLMDGLCVVGAWILILLIAYHGLLRDIGSPAGIQTLILSLAALAIGVAALVVAFMARAKPAFRGMYPMVVGAGLLGVLEGLVAVQESTGQLQWGGTGVSLAFSVAVLSLGWGAGTWSVARIEHGRYERWTGGMLTALPLLSIAVTAVTVVLHPFEGSDTPEPAQSIVAGLVVAVAAARQTLYVADRGRSLSRERAALGRAQEAHQEARAALERTVAMEIEQRRRAELLSRILAASESLLLRPEGHPAYDTALAQLIPDGALAALIRLEGEPPDAVIIAAYGTGAAPLVGLRRGIEAFGPRELERIAAGHPIVIRHAAGGRIPSHALTDGGIMGRIAADTRATLLLPLVSRTDELLGVLALFDFEGERVVDPTFVDLARLVANQLAVAVDNARLMERLREQLAELRRMQAQVVESSRLAAVGELAAGVAHEVNNPLAGILGYTELLLRGLAPDDPARADLEVVRVEALRARHVVRSLLDFASRRPSELHPGDLAEVLQHSIRAVERASDCDPCIVQEIGPLPPVAMDTEALQRAFVNILTNAVQFASSGHTVVAAWLDRAEAVVTVSDEGSGMDEAVQTRAFKPFYTTRSESGAVGLGLTTAQTIIDAHGGHVSLTSEPGVGTTVEVRLPIAGAVVQRAPEPDEDLAADERAS